MKFSTIVLFLCVTNIYTATYSNSRKLILNDVDSTIDGTKLSSTPTNGVAILDGENIVHYESEYASIKGYGDSTLESEWHSKEECNKEKLIEITEAGTYIISGNLSGQLSIKVTEADNASTEEELSRKVVLVLNNVNINSNVAPAIIFYEVHEIDSTEYEDSGIKIEYDVAKNLDFSNAGAQIIIADGSKNIIKGSHVAKCYQYTKNDDDSITLTTKKRAKYDGAFYSKVSMLITAETEGSGVLNIIGDNEGLDTEKHLLIEKGNINIAAQDDGINTNEENGSVTLINGGKVVINGGLGNEGDGIDSNGYLIINGGEVISAGKPVADSGMDADLGIVINGGTSVAVGTSMENASPKSSQPTMNLRFSSPVDSSSTLIVKDSSGKELISFNPSTTGFFSGTEVRGYSGAIISHPEFKLNSTYYIYLDDEQLGQGGNSQNREIQPPNGNGPNDNDQQQPPNRDGQIQPPSENDHQQSQNGNGHQNPQSENGQMQPQNNNMPMPPQNGSLPEPPKNESLRVPPQNGSLPERPKNGSFRMPPQNGSLPEPPKENKRMPPQNGSLPEPPNGDHMPPQDGSLPEPKNNSYHIQPPNASLPEPPKGNDRIPSQNRSGQMQPPNENSQQQIPNGNGQMQTQNEKRKMQAINENNRMQPSNANSQMKPQNRNGQQKSKNRNNRMKPPSGNNQMQPPNENNQMPPQNRSDQMRPPNDNMKPPIERNQTHSPHKKIPKQSQNGSLPQLPRKNGKARPPSRLRTMQELNRDSQTLYQNTNTQEQQNSNEQNQPLNSNNQPPNGSNQMQPPNGSNQMQPPNGSNQMQPPNGSNQMQPKNDSNQMQPPNDSNQMQPPNESRDQNGNENPNSSGNPSESGVGNPNNDIGSSTSKEFILTSFSTTFINVGKYLENTDNKANPTSTNTNNDTASTTILSNDNKVTSESSSYVVQNDGCWISKKSLIMFIILSLSIIII